MRRSLSLFSKRNRIKATVETSSSTPKVEIANPEPQQLLLFHSDKQFQARLIPMAAGTQLLLAFAHSDSLYMVKKRLAEQDRIMQLKEGFGDAAARPIWDFMEWYDYGLTSLVWAAPFVLLLATKLSTSRWIHSLALLPRGMVQIVTYNMLGSKVSRELPVASVMRSRKSAKRIYIDDKMFMLPEKGEFHDKETFERVFKSRQ